MTTTRTSRALTVSSTASTNEDGAAGGGGAPYNHQNSPSPQPQRQQPQPRPSVFDSSNPFAPLVDLSQSARARRDESSSGDTTADGDEEQRGAPL